MGSAMAGPGHETTRRTTRRAGTVGVEGVGGFGGHGRASRSTTPSRRLACGFSSGRPGPKAPGTPAAPQATKTPEPEAVPGSGGGGWGIRTPEGLHPTRFPSVRHRPLGESSVHIVPDNHKRQKALSANPGQCSRSQHLAEPSQRVADQEEKPRASDENPVENKGRDGFA